jgi:hypothetical protein
VPLPGGNIHFAVRQTKAERPPLLMGGQGEHAKLGQALLWIC